MNIDDAVLQMMEQYGGSFVKALADCYRKADGVNRGKLQEAFADYFNHYKHFATREQQHKRAFKEQQP